MDTALASAFSALGGSIVGGLTSGLTTWMSLRSQARAGLRLHTVSQQEDLYREFIVAASRAYGQALTTSEPEIQDVVALFGMIGRMRVLSSSAVVTCAEATLHRIIDTYYLPNRTLRELHETLRIGSDIDPLKTFSEITRTELRGL